MYIYDVHFLHFLSLVVTCYKKYRVTNLQGPFLSLKKVLSYIFLEKSYFIYYESSNSAWNLRFKYHTIENVTNVFHDIRSEKSPTLNVGDKYVSINQLITYTDKINLASQSIWVFRPFMPFNINKLFLEWLILQIL